MRIPPLLIIPLIVYNLVALGVIGDAGAGWDWPVFSMFMSSGGEWTMGFGDLLIASALMLLFFELLKATRTDVRALTDHILSTLILIVYVVEFTMLAAAATSVFFILMLISLVDLLAGFSISIRAASRDVNLG